MAKFLFTNKAIEDLSIIWIYTCETWSENQADKYYEMLIESCRELSINHNLGKKYSQISENIVGFAVGKHIIFYRRINQKEIEVVRILHEMMDLKKSF